MREVTAVGIVCTSAVFAEQSYWVILRPGHGVWKLNGNLLENFLDDNLW